MSKEVLPTGLQENSAQQGKLQIVLQLVQSLLFPKVPSTSPKLSRRASVGDNVSPALWRYRLISLDFFERSYCPHLPQDLGVAWAAGK